MISIKAMNCVPQRYYIGSKASFTGFWYEGDRWGSPHLWAPVVGLGMFHVLSLGTSHVHCMAPLFVSCYSAIFRLHHQLQSCFSAQLAYIQHGTAFSFFFIATQDLITRIYFKKLFREELMKISEGLLQKEKQKLS